MHITSLTDDDRTVCKSQVDDGDCEDTASDVCDADADTCRTCRNNLATADPDQGCEEGGKPLCGAAFNAYGDICHFCINDKTVAGETDTGCPDENNLCVAVEGAYGTECKDCEVEACRFFFL